VPVSHSSVRAIALFGSARGGRRQWSVVTPHRGLGRAEHQEQQRVHQWRRDSHSWCCSSPWDCSTDDDYDCALHVRGFRGCSASWWTRDAVRWQHVVLFRSCQECRASWCTTPHRERKQSEQLEQQRARQWRRASQRVCRDLAMVVLMEALAGAASDDHGGVFKAGGWDLHREASWRR